MILGTCNLAFRVNAACCRVLMQHGNMSELTFQAMTFVECMVQCLQFFIYFRNDKQTLGAHIGAYLIMH